MNIISFTYSREQAEQLAAVAMRETCLNMAVSGYISMSQADEYIQTHTPILLSKESMISFISEKLFGKEDTSVRIVMLPIYQNTS